MSIGPTGVSQVSIGFRMEPDLFGHNSQGSKNIKNPLFSGFCGRHRMLSELIGSGQMVEPGGIEPPSISPTLQDLRT
jgi:hypothetical protein